MVLAKGGAGMNLVLWIAGVLMVVAGALLIADVGAAALWIGVIAVGIATVVIVQTRGHRGVHS
jgi:hypothetical protein